MNQNENNQLLFLAIIILTPVIIYRLQIARRRRGIIVYQLKRFCVYFAAFYIVYAVMPNYGYSKWEAMIFGWFVAMTAAFILIPRPRRDRRIPEEIRRAVIARDLRGQRFNSKLHEIDHIVPFSRGGDHSIKNLRVISRSKNRSRGAKMPRWWDFF